MKKFALLAATAFLALATTPAMACPTGGGNGGGCGGNGFVATEDPGCGGGGCGGNGVVTRDPGCGGGGCGGNG